MSSSPLSAGILLPADRYYRTALFFLVLTAVLAVISTGKLDLFTTVVAPALVLLKGYRWWRAAPPELSQRLATRLIVAYLFFLPWDVLFVSVTLAGRSPNPHLYAALLAAVHFLLFVTVVRLYSAERDRDAIFLGMLVFAGMLVSSVFTVDTSFLIFFLLFLFFAAATFLGLEIRRGASGAVFPGFSARTGGERRFYRALSLAALAATTGAIALGTIFFFLFPRFSAGFFAHGALQPSLMSGFTDNVQLGQIGEIKKNNEVVMRVETGKPVPYPLLRWRGIALTTFDGRRWYTAESRGQPREAAPDGWITIETIQPAVPHPEVQLHYTVLLEPLASDAIFSPIEALRLRGDFAAGGGSYYSTVRRSTLQVDPTGSIYNTAHNFAEIRYEGVSRLPTVRPDEARKSGTVYPEEVRRTYLQLPLGLDPRIPELAGRISRPAGNPFDRAVTIENYLRENFRYTLELAGKPTADPLAHFLFETKAGHCEYFASALAVMLRTLGIPSREVNGFLPGEFNDLAGDYIVRASDAHSWVEAYFPGVGWLTFDPTPPAPDRAEGWLGRFDLYVDWFQLSWNEWVINYDFTRQLTLARNLGESSADWREAGRRKFFDYQEAGMERLKKWQQAHALGQFLLPLGLILVLVALWQNWFGRFFFWFCVALDGRNPGAERNHPLLASRLYAELERLLSKQGFARAESQTPNEFAASRALGAELAPAVREFTDLYAQARFGGAVCDSARLRALLERVRTTPRPGSV